MRRPSLLLSIALGMVTSLVLSAVYYFGAESQDLPFVPFDLFDWLARVLPGGLLTIAIDTMVSLVRGLNLGPTSEVSKAIEQALAVGLMMDLGAALGLSIALLQRRTRWSDVITGGLPGLTLGAIIFVVEVLHGYGGDPIIPLLWFLLPPFVWGLILDGYLRTLASGQRTTAVGTAPTDRRRFLLKVVGGSLTAAIVFFGMGRFFFQRRVDTGAGQPLPAGLPPGGELPAGRPEPVPGTRPEITPSDSFYRIDINLRPLFINRDSWQLQVDGLFDRPRNLTLADLMAYPALAEPRTLSCISNPIGGDLIGTAFWTGLRLRDLLADLGMRPEATSLYVEGGDGFYENIVMADLLDPRTLLVYGMNGQTLPVENGFPLRVLIPNRYGMKQPKWITRIEAVNEPRTGFWPDRGWSQEARPEIITMIDTVATGFASGGRVPVGGIAWSGGRGFQRVELQTDDGPWEEATLRLPPAGPLAWVFWRYDWAPAPGEHTLRVRGVDGTGAVQNGIPTTPHPEGATGYHAVTVRV